MSRFQLSLNVDDVEAAVAFYSTLFDAPPAKHRPGYANFVVQDPPLKLIVIEQEGEPGTINHVGIEFDSTDEVAAETQRIAAAGLPVQVDDPHTCCFATQEKAWTQDTVGVPWELYTVVSDAIGFGASPSGGTPVDVMMPPITADDLELALADPEVVVVDAQGPGGFERAHIDGAVGFDLDDVAGQAADRIGDTDRRVVLYCTDAACQGAEFVGTLLVEAGYTNLGRYADGIDGWRTSGRPVVEGAVATIAPATAVTTEAGAE